PPAAGPPSPPRPLPPPAPIGGGGAPPAAPAPPAPAGQPALDLGVTASGEIAARRSAELSFRVPGTVAEILVDEGSVVQEGQELARLDLAELELGLRQAEAGLAQARAGYERLEEGASAEEVAAARAQVTQAQGAARQARGSVTDQDIAAAEASLASAVARQAEIAAGPKATDLAQAEAAVTQARANLEIQRTNLSAAKTNAQLQVEQAANALRDAQKAYSDIYWQNHNLERRLDRFDIDLPEEAREAEEQALRQVENAEARLSQATLAVEQASQNEVDGIQAAEAQVRTAEATRQQLLDGATADQRAAVDAQVAQARATLDKLRGEQRAGAVQAADAGTAAAQANLERLLAGASPSQLAQALAQVEAAEAGVESARLNLEKGTLRAPFGGVVAQVNVDVGDLAGGAAQLPAIQIVDTSELRVEVNVSDTDVARIREGMPARVTVDALPGTSFDGTVTYIAPTATNVGNVRTFAVRITLDQQEALRAGMSARVAILVDG
ncbi:MAG TPA: HlyD family efflux transporter periplasmic adaptor subunit, partial [Chloroflexaceae bacterium]|nr:HlyD family efflux transporter periplasmic adaptor subunit [Chloroflexaceae bacterium]